MSWGCSGQTGPQQHQGPPIPCQTCIDIPPHLRRMTTNCPWLNEHAVVRVVGLYTNESTQADVSADSLLQENFSGTAEHHGVQAGKAGHLGRCLAAGLAAGLVRFSCLIEATRGSESVCAPLDPARCSMYSLIASCQSSSICICLRRPSEAGPKCPPGLCTSLLLHSCQLGMGKGPHSAAEVHAC